MIVALSGGVGGAKLVRGLALAGLAPTAVVNTADDFTHWGLHVSPDLDSVTYALAGWADPERGWGVRDESWHALETVGRYGGQTWFRLGDRDLATHLLRTQGLRQGKSLTQVTAELTGALGLGARVLPMSDDSVRTQLQTPQGWLDFQVYFVRERCAPPVRGVRFAGVDRARPTPEVLGALAGAALIVLCPSNPVVSLDPILALPGLRDALRAARAPVVAVSPLVQGKAVKGPTVEMLRGLGEDASPVAVAARYRDVLDGFVLDARDAALAPRIEALGLRVRCTETLMVSDEAKRALALEVARGWAAA